MEKSVSPARAQVELYTWEFCGYCVRAKRLLEAKGARYAEYRVDTDDEAHARMLQRAPGRYTVPQIFINGRHVGGWTELFQLESAGKLDALLSEAPANEQT